MHFFANSRLKAENLASIVLSKSMYRYSSLSMNIGTIEMPIVTIDWDVETYQNNIFLTFNRYRIDISLVLINFFIGEIKKYISKSVVQTWYSRGSKNYMCLEWKAP